MPMNAPSTVEKSPRSVRSRLGRVLRWFGLAVGLVLLLFILVLGAAYWRLSTLDLNAYKPEIIELAHQYTGRDLTIEGDIGLKFGLSPALQLNLISLANAEWSDRDSMVQIGRLSVALDLWGVLGGVLRVREIVVLDSQIVVEQNADGQFNFEFEPPQPLTEGAPLSPDSTSDSMSDSMSDSTDSMSDSTLDSPSDSTPEPQAEAEPMDEAVADSPQAGFPIVPVIDRVELRDVSLVMIATDGSGQSFTVERLLLLGDGLESPMSLEARLQALGLDIDIGGQIGAPATLVDASRDWAVSMAVEAAGAQLQLAASIRDVQAVSGVRFSARADIESLENSLVALAPVLGDSSVSVPAGLSPLSLRVSDGVLPALSQALTIGKIEFSFGPQNEGATGGNRLEAKLSAEPLALPRPSVDVELASESLDLSFLLAPSPPDEVAAPEEEAPPPTAARADERVLPDDPLPFELLGLVDAELSVSIDRIVLNRLASTDVALEASLRNEDLRVRRARFLLYDRIIDLSARVTSGRGSAPEVRVKAQSDGLDTTRAVFDLFAVGQASDPAPSLPFLLDMELTMQGESVRALAASMNGTTQLALASFLIPESLYAPYTESLPAQFQDSIRGDFISKPLQCFYVEAEWRRGPGDLKGVGLSSQHPVFVRGDVNAGTEAMRVTMLLVGSVEGKPRLVFAPVIEGRFGAPRFSSDGRIITRGWDERQLRLAPSSFMRGRLSLYQSAMCTTPLWPIPRGALETSVLGDILQEQLTPTRQQLEAEEQKVKEEIERQADEQKQEVEQQIEEKIEEGLRNLFN